MSSKRLAVIVVFVSLFLPVAFVCGRSVIFDWYRQSSGSMEPTLAVNSPFVPVLKCAYQLRLPFTSVNLLRTAAPRLGDVVVLRNPDGGTKHFIKRVMALPGDTFEMRNETVILNGAPLRLSFSEPTTRTNGETVLLGTEQVGSVTHPVLILPERPALRNFGPITVPPGEVFLLGDNRDESRDSRFFGTRPLADLIGRVLL